MSSTNDVVDPCLEAMFGHFHYSHLYLFVRVQGSGDDNCKHRGMGEQQRTQISLVSGSSKSTIPFQLPFSSLDFSFKHSNPNDSKHRVSQSCCQLRHKSTFTSGNLPSLDS
eukprot:scaffold10626_cov112-Cylindrotheca_fusiformis.AAC.16